jgi:hypothetical protein
MDTDFIITIAKSSVFICVNLWFHSSYAIPWQCSRLMLTRAFVRGGGEAMPDAAQMVRTAADGAGAGIIGGCCATAR